MVFTAVLAAIAVIAAMVTVPGAKAQDADGEAIQIQPDNDSFGSDTEKLAGAAKGWGTMVWAGAPVKDPNKEWTTDFGKAGNRGSNAGWAWCVDISKAEPMRNTAKYDIATAGKAPIPENLRDAAINVATLSKQALKKGEEGRQTVATYSYYLSALIGDNSSSKIARHGIVDPESMKNDEYVGPVFKDFKGSLKEFESLTGFTINPNEPWELQKLDSVSVPKAPEGAFITLVGPNGRLTGPTKPGEKIGKNANDQRVMPPDQPGLPDNPDNGGGSEEPTTSDENTAEETTSENSEEETSSSETTTDSEPTDSEETTTEDTEEPTPGKTTDVVPNPEPTPTTSEQEKKLEPKISTNADFEDGSHEVVAGAKIVDEVSYEGLVPNKEYTLKAELISKDDGKTVLGKGEKTFTPKESEGKEPVTITVNDDVTEPVEAAVAFEELTSTDVDEFGEDTPDASSDNPNEIAEHKDIKDEDQTVTSKKTDEPSSSEPVVPEKPSESDEPSDQPSESDKPSEPDEPSDEENPSDKPEKGTTPWWIYLIPGIGLGKIIKDHQDQDDHGNHDGGNGKHADGHNGGNGHEVKGQDAPKGGNSDNGHGRGVEVQGQEPEETGNALPSNAERVEIKSVPSGATELEPGMQDYIK